MAALGHVAGSPEEAAAVRHLVELGYEDPLEVAIRAAALQRAQQSQLNRAEELLKAGELRAAIELLEAASQAAPDWTGCRHLLARAYFRAGRFGAAGETLDWLELHAVEHAELALMRAAMALKRRRLDEARDQAEYARCLQIPLPAAELILGEVHFRRRELDAAEAAYRSALRHGGSEAPAYAGLAAIALQRGEYELAVESSLEAVEQDFRLWPAHYRLGVALVQLERWPEARVALETAARLNPAIAGPYRWLAQLCNRQNDAAMAAEFRRRAHEVIERRRSNRR
jgi:tetratricopeptide (TPR) repeat protein